MSDSLQQPPKNARKSTENKVIFHQGAKKHWKLRSRQNPTLIIADQNVEFVKLDSPDLEVHCFPGLTLDYLKSICKVENTSRNTSRIIIWTGNNDLHRESFDFSIAKLWRASLTNLRKAFPGASIFVVQSFCPPNASALHKNNCRKTNQLLSNHRSVSLVSLDTKDLVFRRDLCNLERESASDTFAAILKGVDDLSKN